MIAINRASILLSVVSACATMPWLQAWGQSRLDLGQRSVEASGESVYLSFSKFKIPFNVQANAGDIGAVQLRVSTDGGETWQLQGAAKPTDREFTFRAAAEGRYLFSVQTVDARGEVFPSPNPPLDVIIDTTEPRASVAADVNELGQLLVEVQMMDEFLDLDSAALLYRTDRNQAWQSLELPELTLDQQGIYSGSIAIDIGSCREVALILSVSDKSQNTTEATFRLDMPRTAAGNQGMTLASTGQGSSKLAHSSGTHPQVGSQHSRVESLPSLPGTDGWESAEDPRGHNSAGGRAGVVELRRPGRLTSGLGGLQLESSSGAENSYSPALHVPMPNSSASDVPATPSYAGNDYPADTFPTRDYHGHNSPVPTLPNQSSPAYAAEELPAPPRTGLEPTIPSPQELETQAEYEPTTEVAQAYQCKSRTFALDYSIESLGGNAVADVELWGTEDGGDNWQRWGSDPDRQSPFDVQVGNDGLFGFRMVVIGSDGRITNRPKAGSQADMWINVDTQAPAAKITRAVYGEGADDGKLHIDYTCQDPYLLERPISLFYSPSLDGEWKTITSGQENSGRYVWKPPTGLPSQIYLRLDVADKAGNVGVHRLELPIDTIGLAPHGRIEGFRPIISP